MQTSKSVRRAALWLAASFGLLLLICTGLIVCVNAGYLRRPLLQFVSTRAGHPIQIAGSLHVQLLSASPRIDAAQVTIGNPSWCPPGTVAVIDHITLIMGWPGWHRPFAIERLELAGANLSLWRDEAGRANWQQSYPLKRAGANLPLLRSLDIAGARVALNDARRHLQFKGVASAGGHPLPSGEILLEIRAQGLLNDRPMGLDLLGQPLLAAEPGAPYRFTFDQRSSGSRLSGTGRLPRAFDFALIDADFEASGLDLRDLYYLTGVHLIDTGDYRLTGHYVRSGFQSTFSALHVRSGQSDMRGSVTVDASNASRNLAVDLHSQVLRLADLGPAAAARQTRSGRDPGFILSTIPLNVAAIRKADAQVNFKADRLVVNRAVLEAVTARMTIQDGHVEVQPVTGHIMGGTFDAHLSIDASLDQPSADLELNLVDVQLGQWREQWHEPPPFEGLLRARLKLKGRGESLHEVFASAEGTANAGLNSGSMRKVLAELSGVDLRGLGLLLSRSKQDTNIRCARARFDARAGIFTAAALVIDTDPVLITGSGAIDLGKETLDFEFQGHPKDTRLLRIEAPIQVTGTLRRPVIGLKVQGAKLKLVDRGGGVAVDCPSAEPGAEARAE